MSKIGITIKGKNGYSFIVKSVNLTTKFYYKKIDFYEVVKTPLSAIKNDLQKDFNHNGYLFKNILSEKTFILTNSSVKIIKKIPDETWVEVSELFDDKLCFRGISEKKPKSQDVGIEICVIPLLKGVVQNEALIINLQKDTVDKIIDKVYGAEKESFFQLQPERTKKMKESMIYKNGLSP